MTLLRSGVTILGDSTGRLSIPYSFRDNFNRDDGAIGNGWTEGHDYSSTYAPLGVSSNKLAVLDAQDNTNTGEQSPGYPYDGIGCIWRDTGVTDIAVKIKVTELATNFREATPLLHVTPGTSRHGVGAWLSSFPPATQGVLIVSYIGNPASLFGDSSFALAIGLFTRPATDSYFTIRSVGGELTCWLDDTQISLTLVTEGDEGMSAGAISSFTVHPDLADSTLHGVALDCHFDLSTPETGMVDDVWMSSIS